MEKELKPVQFVDLVQPERENSSSNGEEEPENRTKRFYVNNDFVKLNKNPKKSDELIIKDMIINNHEDVVKIERKEAIDQGFPEANDSFKEKNWKKKDSFQILKK